VPATLDAVANAQERQFGAGNPQIIQVQPKTRSLDFAQQRHVGTARQSRFKSKIGVCLGELRNTVQHYAPSPQQAGIGIEGRAPFGPAMM
jgi:hypothetical protein